MEGLDPAENSMVIFDESRHPQNAVLADSYNTIYFLLVYFTGEGLAMLVLFLILFISFVGLSAGWLGWFGWFGWFGWVGWFGWFG